MSYIPYLLSPDSMILMKAKILAAARTQYQPIMIVETEEFGKILLIEGATQLSEKDEAIYHEALVHPTLCNCEPKNVLIIGGADGGTLREVLKHPVDKATLVDIDGELLELCRKHIPIAEAAFEDKRAKIIIDDGIKFIEQTEEKYDAIILDLADPEGPAKYLFTKEFYAKVKSKLNKDGVMAAQIDSPIVQPDVTGRAFEAIKQTYQQAEIIGLVVPSFFAGNALAIGKDGKITKDIAKIIQERGIKLKAHTPEQLNKAFDKPVWMNELLRKEWTPSTEKDPAVCTPEESITKRIKEAQETVEEYEKYLYT